MSGTDDAAARELIRQQVEQHGGLVIFAEEAEHVSGLAERLSDRIIAALRAAGHLRTTGTVEVERGLATRIWNRRRPYVSTTSTDPDDDIAFYNAHAAGENS